MIKRLGGVGLFSHCGIFPDPIEIATYHKSSDCKWQIDLPDCALLSSAVRKVGNFGCRLGLSSVRIYLLKSIRFLVIFIDLYPLEPSTLTTTAHEFRFIFF